MVTLIHTADWQIGRQFEPFGPEDGPILAEARLEAVARIARLASERAVHAVLVAGDIFDAQGVADRTIRRLFDALSGYPGPWVLLPGNHDAALAESVWSRAQRLGVIPPHVHLALQPQPLRLPTPGAAVGGLAILPAPLTQRHTFEDLTAWFDGAETPEGWLRIGLAHGAVQGVLPDDIDSPNPIAAGRADSARLDYLALGDWHGTLRVNDRTWYSGTPEPDRFRANDAGNVLEVALPGPGAAPIVTPYRIARHPWIALHERLDVASDADRLAQMLAELPAQAVVQLRLSGRLDLAAHARLQQAVQRAQARVRALRLDSRELQLQPTDADLAALHADGYLGDVIAELRERQSGAEAEIARTALVLLADILREEGGGHP